MKIYRIATQTVIESTVGLREFKEIKKGDVEFSSQVWPVYLKGSSGYVH